MLYKTTTQKPHYNESLGRGQIFVISGIRFIRDDLLYLINETFSGLKIRYNREFGLSGFAITGLLSTYFSHSVRHSATSMSLRNRVVVSLSNEVNLNGHKSPKIY